MQLHSKWLHLAFDEWFCTNGCLQLLHFLGGSSDERSARVHNGFTAPFAKSQPICNIHPGERCPESRQSLEMPQQQLQRTEVGMTEPGHYTDMQGGLQEIATEDLREGCMLKS